jgi:hypothetical protein
VYLTDVGGVSEHFLPQRAMSTSTRGLGMPPSHEMPGHAAPIGHVDRDPCGKARRMGDVPITDFVVYPESGRSNTRSHGHG